MRIGRTSLGIAALGAIVLAGCYDSTGGTNANAAAGEGSLVYSPPLRIASLTAAALTAQLGATAQGQQLLALAGAPTCGVDFYLIQYATVGGATPPEPTRASGALMVPTGAGCTGARSIVEYAHQTSTVTSYNIADVTDTNNDAYAEGGMITAMFAAKGYIVVAPNFVGYDQQDVATLPYHPYLNAVQQSQEMMDALAAARSVLKSGIAAGVTDNGKLFLTGYSSGGHVAMATHKAMQALGMSVTASAPMSGPYAMEAFGDAVLFGSVPLGSTHFFPLIINSYQRAYGNLYNATTDIYEAAYATGIDTLLPNPLPYTTLYAQGKLPEFALFDSTTPVTGNATLDAALAVPANPVFAKGFGTPALFNNTGRLGYALDALASPDGAVPTPTAGVPLAAAPQFPFRLALKKNDMRSWTPNGTAPILLCGGHNDPSVFFLNTQTMAGYWPTLISTSSPPNPPNNLVTILDVDPSTTQTGPIATQVGTIAGTVFGTDLAGGVTSAATFSNDVMTAVIGAYAPYFTIGAQGATPNSPQGVLVAGLASLAAQVVVSEFSAGVKDPTAVGTLATDAAFAYYHNTLVEPACLVAVSGLFASL